MHTTALGGDALMFVADPAATFGDARPARLPDWTLANADGGSFPTRALGGALEGAVVPVMHADLRETDKLYRKRGLARAIAMVEVGGDRTWAFFYTRTTDWREGRTALS